MNPRKLEHSLFAAVLTWFIHAKLMMQQNVMCLGELEVWHQHFVLEDWRCSGDQSGQACPAEKHSD